MPIMSLSDDIAIHYATIHGSSQKPVLVFLHEGLGCVPMWKDFPERLCRKTGHPGLLYDRRGYGKSSPHIALFTPDYMHLAAEEELPEVLAKVVPDSPYILIGHSDGGSIALIHAAEKPPLCRAVVTEAAHAFVEEITLAGVRSAIASWEDGRLSAVLEKYHTDNAKLVFRNWSKIWLSQEFRLWNIEKLLPEIEVPALIIQGAEDQYGSPHQVAAITGGMHDRARSAMVKSCGHAPHHEQPETILALMADFILGL